MLVHIVMPTNIHGDVQPPTGVYADLETAKAAVLANVQEECRNSEIGIHWQELYPRVVAGTRTDAKWGDPVCVIKSMVLR